MLFFREAILEISWDCLEEQFSHKSNAPKNIAANMSTFYVNFSNISPWPAFGQQAGQDWMVGRVYFVRDKRKWPYSCAS